MVDRVEAYIREVISCMVVEDGLKHRIASDLRTHIQTACETDSVEVVLRRMGSPTEVAREFMDSIYEDKSEVIDRLIKQKTMTEQMMHGYEYRSKTTVFGLPLVHIRFKPRHGVVRIRPYPVAKGIIAIGDIAIGVISIGGIALGGLSLGGVSLGLLLSMGGCALGGIAIGGFAVGLLALGGLAVGLFALGGVAMGEIAMGGVAVGNVAIGNEVDGNFILSNKVTPITKEAAYALIKAAYPKLGDWIVRILSSIASTISFQSN